MRLTVFAFTLCACGPTTTVVDDTGGAGDPSDTAGDTDSAGDTGADSGDDTGSDSGGDTLSCAGRWSGELSLSGEDPRGELRELCTGTVELQVDDDGATTGTGLCEAGGEAPPDGPPPPSFELELLGDADLKCTLDLVVTLAPPGLDVIAEDDWTGVLDGDTGTLQGEGVLTAPEGDPQAPPEMPYTAAATLGR